ncbi:MAG: AraC family transcriptional regulator [Fulvivirga sp.]
MKRLTLHIRNMVCPSCVTLLQHEFEQIGIRIEKITLGKATILKSEELSVEDIERILNRHGFASIKDDEVVIVEEIKLAVLELINRQAQYKNIMRNSEFIAREVGKSNRTLTKVFAKYENLTIEKYIIQQKIKRTKEFLDEGELSLSEIAAQLGYSSVQHLSGQFKKVEGNSVRDYRKKLIT